MTVHNIMEKQPHMTGDAVCLVCKAKWVAVVPTGTLCLECPECGTMRGVLNGNPIPADKMLMECDCGCVHYNIRPDGRALCCLCGVSHEL